MRMGRRDEGNCSVFGLGANELLIVLAVILVLFGGTQLPKLARSLGQAHREFRDETNNPAEPDDAA
jgi:sec-independent protein translocase protein TatA